MRYLVDFGDKCKVLSERKLIRYYTKYVDKTEYEDISDWKWDMMRSGLITEII